MEGFFSSHDLVKAQYFVFSRFDSEGWGLSAPSKVRDRNKKLAGALTTQHKTIQILKSWFLYYLHSDSLALLEFQQVEGIEMSIDRINNHRKKSPLVTKEWL